MKITKADIGKKFKKLPSIYNQACWNRGEILAVDGMDYLDEEASK